MDAVPNCREKEEGGGREGREGEREREGERRIKGITPRGLFLSLIPDISINTKQDTARTPAWDLFFDIAPVWPTLFDTVQCEV